LLQTKENTGVS